MLLPSDNISANSKTDPGAYPLELQPYLRGELQQEMNLLDFAYDLGRDKSNKVIESRDVDEDLAQAKRLFEERFLESDRAPVKAKALCHLTQKTYNPATGVRVRRAEEAVGALRASLAGKEVDRLGLREEFRSWKLKLKKYVAREGTDEIVESDDEEVIDEEEDEDDEQHDQPARRKRGATKQVVESSDEDSERLIDHPAKRGRATTRQAVASSDEEGIGETDPQEEEEQEQPAKEETGNEAKS